MPSANACRAAAAMAGPSGPAWAAAARAPPMPSLMGSASSAGSASAVSEMLLRYCELRTEPMRAMPIAPPISRTVSLSAEATLEVRSVNGGGAFCHRQAGLLDPRQTQTERAGYGCI